MWEITCPRYDEDHIRLFGNERGVGVLRAWLRSSVHAVCQPRSRLLPAHERHLGGTLSSVPSGYWDGGPVKVKRVGDPTKSLESKANTHSGVMAYTLLTTGSTISSV